MEARSSEFALVQTDVDSHARTSNNSGKSWNWHQTSTCWNYTHTFDPNVYIFEVLDVASQRNSQNRIHKVMFPRSGAALNN